ncbi:tRNA (adenosine(37)-N6)-dimethylallyltransferase MiaA [Chitinophaga rhizosphaerae]|uniref:tRNA (adenosine(37)-N6)-dimethylallyltransferase MiaA n=1 Tax=Chitinophaga rhizosphaerae TaxID=1864947 RepID=UPI000F80360B|nr:tRNA (adenosine(37)-N6)-dimethylallyltransferase MiaA [Chitinophaga rhizosphaerae]
MNKTVILVAGPTAVGKTATAIRIAQMLGTEIISADSRQCYREISIGTAKPSAEELATVRHYFIDSHSITEEVNAAAYESLAMGYAQDIFSRHDTLVVTGGTGLYIKAFLEGMDDMPPVPAAVRDAVRAGYVAKGISWLQEQLQAKDPEFFATAETRNPHRLIRALEIFEATGQSINAFRTQTARRRDFDVIKTGLGLPKELLHANIHKRVDQMMARGLVEEVRSVLPYRLHNALQTVGYTEIFEYLDGNSSLESAVEGIKTHTRQYAKRQMTWFRRDPDLTWFDARSPEAVEIFVRGRLGIS